MGRGILSSVLPLDQLDLAAALHDGDRYGEGSYRKHLLDVYTRLIHEPLPVLIAGAFHDSLEDGCITEAALRMLIGDEATNLVVAVTRHTRTLPGEDPEPYSDYIGRVIRFGPDAMRIKLADLEANLEADPPGDLARRYQTARQRILDALEA